MMKQQTVTQIILTAEAGLYLTDGESYGKTVILPETADVSAWKEVCESELPEEVENYV